MMIMILVILLVLISNSYSYNMKLYNSIMKNTINNRKAIIIPIISLGLGFTNPMIVLSDQTEEKVVLTASEVLNADVQPKIDLLKEVMFTIKLFPTIVEQGDYSQIRRSFRSAPTIELRKTCRKLIPFLEIDKRKSFENAYQAMIEELDYLDVVCLRREQNEGLPDKGKKDTVILDQITKLTNKFEAMLSIVL